MTTMHLTRKTLDKIFKPAYLRRGQDYFDSKRVFDTKVKQGGNLITASVHGSGNRIYNAQIRLNSKNNQVNDIKGSCSCPVAYNCKHVAATLLNYIEEQADGSKDLFGQASDKWLYQLKAAKVEQSGLNPSTELLLYILASHPTASGSQLTVNTVKTRLLKDGSYAEAHHFNGDPHSRARFMREEDPFILIILKSLGLDAEASLPILKDASGARTLEALLETGRCHWQDLESPALRQAENKSTRLSWSMQADASQKIQAADLDDRHVLLPLNPPHYINRLNSDCGIVECGLPDAMAAQLIASPAVRAEDVEKVSRFLEKNLKDPDIPFPVKPVMHEIESIIPVPFLQLLNDDDDYYYVDDSRDITGIARLHFDYGSKSIHPYDKETRIINQTQQGFTVIKRNLQFEAEVIDRLDDLGLIADDFHRELDQTLQLEPVHVVDTWLDFMLHHKLQLLSEGWTIEVAHDFIFQIDQADQWYADVDESSNDWFTLELGIEVEGTHVNLLPFLVNYLGTLKGAHVIQDLRQLPDDYPLLMKQENGHLLHIPLIKVRHIIETLVELYDPNVLNSEGKLELSRYHSRQLAVLDQRHVDLSWAGGKTLRKFGERLQNFDGIQDVKPPASLKTELRDYQKEGLNWLQFLREYELGGILADDMGLGKTVQALAHLLVEKKSRRADRPSLVVAPTSLMVNWKREAEKFSPSLKVLVLQGQERKEKFSQIDQFDIVLTTYPLLSRDTTILLKQQWHIVILDEAQHIKNPRSKTALTACQLDTRHRLCLTGTPMENHLGELWSQFNFLMPGLLGVEKRFRTLFRSPIEKHQDVDRQHQLRERVAPFMLRRNKSEVAKELPPKTEILSEVELDGAQRDLYETIRVSMHSKVWQAIDQKGIARSQIVILDALLKLRQVCCHPQLLKIPSAQKVKHSAKLNQLMEMLPEMVEEGRRILLFSQFTSMLAIIEEELISHKIKYVKLTGQTKNRQVAIDEFQAGDVPVFLISLKAGGSGLNLTAADTVIHYDPWWNPAAENQATDRAHRIGQDKPVFVYKMITSSTVEEKIIQMQLKKQALADALFAEGSKGSAISNEDLQALFAPLA